MTARRRSDRGGVVGTFAAAAGVLIAVAALVGGCAGTTPPSTAPSTIVTGTRTVVTTQTVAATPTGTPSSVAPFPPDGNAPAGETLGSCPYIAGGLDSQPTDGPNLADLEGDRVGRITVLTGYHPVGCRFYFSYAYGEYQHEAIADIRPYTFASPTEAYQAMINMAAVGTDEMTRKDFVPGLTGILFRTEYFGPYGDQCWAFVFAKGNHVVGVYTQRKDLSLNAVNIAQAIAGKF